MIDLVKKTLTSLIFCLLFPSSVFALKLSLPNEGEDLFGKLTSTAITPADTIAGIARKHDLGFFELLEANPKLNPKKLLPGTEIIIPGQHLLPHVPRKGIVINLSTMRLYYFPKNKKYFYTYPIGIGKVNWSTPVGKLSIIEKIVNPVWHVPDSIYEYRKKNGEPIPHIIPSGPKNPLGYYALRLSKPTYLIHDTNEPASVGIRSSAGCIHLYPEDIKELFEMVKINTPVLIINQPYTAGFHDNNLYVEAHFPLEEDRLQLSRHVLLDTFSLTKSVGRTLKDINEIDVFNIIHFHTGVPTEVRTP